MQAKDTVVKYALKGINTPVGVAEYEFTKALPKQFKGEIPSIAELEAEIEKEYDELKSPGQKRFEILKKKIALIKNDEIQQTATTEILFDIIDHSIIPLYGAVINRMGDFKDWFHSSNYSITGIGKNITNINELAQNWKTEEIASSGHEFYFTFWLCAFKKAGTEAFDSVYQLIFKIGRYSYDFTLLNHNDHQPIIKKLYPGNLTKEDINSIVDTVYNKVMDDIEGQIERLVNNENA